MKKSILYYLLFITIVMSSCSEKNNDLINDTNNVESSKSRVFNLNFGDMTQGESLKPENSKGKRYEEEGKNFIETFEIVWSEVGEGSIGEIDEEAVKGFLEASPYAGTIEADKAYKIVTETISTLMKYSPEEIINSSNLSDTSKGVFTDLMKEKISLEEAEQIITTKLNNQGEQEFMLASLSRIKVIDQVMGNTNHNRNISPPWDHIVGYTGAGAIIGGAIGGWPGAGIGAVVGFIVGVLTK